jgi:hypothetical protein
MMLLTSLSRETKVEDLMNNQSKQQGSRRTEERLSLFQISVFQVGVGQ